MKRCSSHALRLWLVVLALAAMSTPGRAAAGAHLLIRAIPVGILPDALVLDVAAHRLFVANTGPQVPVAPETTQSPEEAYRNSPGSVSVIDTQTNQVVATLPADVWPQQMVLDSRRQRLYVLCAFALPIHLTSFDQPANPRTMLDVIDTRTLHILARRRLAGVTPVDISVPFYPSHVLTFDPASNHLLVQAFSPTTVAYLYDATTLRLLRTYPAPPPSPAVTVFAAQSPTTPLLIYLVGRAATAVGQPWLINLATGVSRRLRDTVLFRTWRGPLPYYGKDLTWSPDIRGMYATSTIRRLLVLVAYSTEYQNVPGPPYTLGVYNLRSGAMLRQLVFADGPPRGQQAVAFDERLGRYYALGTTPDPKHPAEGAAVNNIVIGDLRTGAVVHTTPGKGWLTVVLADPARHLLYAASGNGVAEGQLGHYVPGPNGGVQAAAGVLQVIDGRTGATLATGALPKYTVKTPGFPPAQVPGQVSAMALDPTTGKVYAVDGHGGNAVYVISLKRS